MPWLLKTNRPIDFSQKTGEITSIGRSFIANVWEERDVLKIILGDHSQLTTDSEEMMRDWNSDSVREHSWLNKCVNGEIIFPKNADKGEQIIIKLEFYYAIL